MLFSINLFNDSAETTEWTFHNLNGIINQVRTIKILLKLSLLSRTQHTIDIALWNWCWFIQTSKETQNIREETQRMRYITLQFGLHKNITWKRNLFFNDSLSITHSCMLLNWNQHLRNICC